MPASLQTRSTLAGRGKHTSSSVMLTFMDRLACWLCSKLKQTPVCHRHVHAYDDKVMKQMNLSHRWQATGQEHEARVLQ